MVTASLWVELERSTWPEEDQQDWWELPVPRFQLFLLLIKKMNDLIAALNLKTHSDENCIFSFL